MGEVLPTGLSDSSYAYVYDLAGNRATMTTGGRTTSYSYDADNCPASGILGTLGVE